MKTTIFRNFNEVVENKEILKILADIKSGEYKNAITYLRKSLADDKKEAAERAKKSLPAFTPTATFKGGRKMEFLQEYNGIIVLDIEKLEIEKLQQCRTKILMDDYVFACFISPSGNGIKIFVKVTTDAEQHKDSFLKLQRYFEELLAVEIDKSGKDITRLCFVSYDPETYINENSAVFASIAKQSTQSADISEEAGSKLTVAPPVSKKSKIQDEPTSDLIYTHAVKFTENKMQFVEGNRNNFVFTLANNLNRKGISESMALGYILADYGYNLQEVTNAVKSAYQNTAEHNTDKFIPKNPGLKRDKKSSVTLSIVEGQNKNPEDGNFSDDEEDKISYIDKLEMF